MSQPSPSPHILSRVWGSSEVEGERSTFRFSGFSGTNFHWVAHLGKPATSSWNTVPDNTAPSLPHSCSSRANGTMSTEEQDSWHTWRKSPQIHVERPSIRRTWSQVSPTGIHPHLDCLACSEVRASFYFEMVQMAFPGWSHPRWLAERKAKPPGCLGHSWRLHTDG